MSDFTFTSSGVPEYTVKVGTTDMVIHVSKAGGGIVGEEYSFAYWDTALTFDGSPVYVLEYASDGVKAFYTGSPRTHKQVASEFAGFASSWLATNAGDLEAFAAG